MTSNGHSTTRKIKGLIKLNIRALKLILLNKWLSPDIYADSYNRLSENYDSNWRHHIEMVSINLVERLQETKPLRILDLGCGTGLSTRKLALKFPSATVTGVDVSPGMLIVAKKIKTPSNVRYINEDMLTYLEKSEPSGFDIIFSSWAIGYSKPGEIIAQSSRVLKTGGVFAFIVNYANTLPEVFKAYKQTMLIFPEQMKMAMRPDFPPNKRYLEKNLNSSGFSIQHSRDDSVPINVQRSEDGKILPWLLGTGVLAGFDQAMSLDRECPGKDYFESSLSGIKTIHHHFAEAIAIKNES